MQQLNIERIHNFPNEYLSEIEVDILKEKKLVFQIKDYIFEVHVTDNNEMDYSLYNVNTAQLLDGGVIDILDEDYFVSDLVTYIAPNKLIGVPINNNEIIFYNYNQFQDLLK